MVSLLNLEDLRQACLAAQSAEQDKDWYRNWALELKEFIEYVADADLAARSSEEFHQRIWEQNPVSAVGMGTIPVNAAIDDPQFREWVARSSLQPLPESGEPRRVALKKFHDELTQRVSKYTSRTPRLKIHRVLAGFFPKDFTTVSHLPKLRRLRSAILGPQQNVGVTQHQVVLARLEEALGPTSNNLDAIVDRMRLPWLLYTQFVAPKEEIATEKTNERPGTEKLVSLPAARRRRGLTGISGGLPSISAILESCRDGISREDLKDAIRAVNSSLKDSSINTSINVLMSEFNCLKRDGDQYSLTERGESFLETGDTSELADWLVTQILGVDHVLVWLREQESISYSALVSMLQEVNPGWTTNFAPSLLVNWLRFLDLLFREEDGIVRLTELGKEWASRIDWKPESLPAIDATLQDDDEVLADLEHAQQEVALPALDTIVERIKEIGHFSDQILHRLHNGLWSHKRRHFAVLTGLSGSGKTLLARAYGEAIASDAARQLRTIPVQPGWYDPTPVLGYVNPLQGESYVRTSCLEFLLRANMNPSIPHTLVLDEMNLSRPEQYLAPILSAMETGAPIQLHSEGDVLDGIPDRISYPNNLVIIGTVNMDETTHGLSDKVLDRAFIIDFWDIDLAAYPGWGSREIDPEVEKIARELLSELMDALAPARLHFGWRTVDDVLSYLERAVSHAANSSAHEILDAVVYAKILPKLRGDDSLRFREALSKCADSLSQFELLESHAKVLELQNDLVSSGSARFWR